MKGAYPATPKMSFSEDEVDVLVEITFTWVKLVLCNNIEHNTSGHAVKKQSTN